MQIGALSAIQFTPYVYNANRISRASMNKISAIPEDVTKQKVDYTGLLSEDARNTNPLKRGTSANFADILSSQMSMSRYHQANLMAQESPASDETKETEPQSGVVVDSVEKNAFTNMNNDAQTQTGPGMNYRMNQAIQAYNMSMGIA